MGKQPARLAAYLPGGLPMIALAKPIFFLLGSVALAWMSRATLRNPRVHGFYRFFAWESLLGLFLINAGHWFEDPFSLRQLLAWSLLLTSAILVFESTRLFRGLGAVDRKRHDPTLVAIERTTELVTRGVYGYIRHPMYSSLLCLGWGTFLKDVGWASTLLALFASAMLLVTAMVEERENLRYFGEPYRHYMKRTKMFVPFLI